jgi:hypothetical protein
MPAISLGLIDRFSGGWIIQDESEHMASSGETREADPIATSTSGINSRSNSGPITQKCLPRVHSELTLEAGNIP